MKISAVALIKMAMHAKSGGEDEVMGMLQGYPRDNTMYIMDIYCLPVIATMTSVQMDDRSLQFMVAYNEMCKSVDRLENIVGWYHSHPGYGCFLSGQDVKT